MLDEQRPVYVSSGRFNLSDFVVAASIVSGVGLLLASILAWLTSQDSYGAGTLWFFPAAIVCWLVRRVVGTSKTRNRLLGFALGLLAGTLMVFGMYHIDQCSRWGIGWERIDRLPGYITFRMETDAWEDRGHAALIITPAPVQAGIAPWHPPRLSLNAHWLGFLGEVVFMILIPAMFGLLRARRPFSESLDEWFRQESLVLTHDSADGLRSAMKSGTLGEWIATGVEKTGVMEKHKQVTFWYCSRPAATGPSESSVYVAFGSGPLYLLEPEEAATLSQLVPGLSEIATHVEAQYEDESASPDDPTVARLIKVPGPHVRAAKKPSVKWWGRIKLYGMHLLIIPAAVPVALLAYLVGANPPPVATPRWILIVSFFIALIAWVIFFRWLFNEEDNPIWRMLVRHYRNVIAGEMALRTEVLVSPNDPRVIYVEIIPRQNWANLSERKQESESGFLLFDTDREQLLFEGDRSRFIIPAASILRFDLEDITKTQSSAGFYAVVLVARTKTGTHAFPFAPLMGIDGSNRLEKAEALQKRLQAEFGTTIQQNSPDGSEIKLTNMSRTGPQSRRFI